MFSTLLIILAVIMRFIPHVPNFSPLVAVALFSGYALKNKFAVIVPLAAFIISDTILGYHNILPFTWGSILLIYVIGRVISKKLNIRSLTLSTLGASTAFYLLTNFGVWLMTGFYTKNSAGLIDCYIMAIPFFRTSLLSDLAYSAVFFGCYAWAGNAALETHKAIK